MICLTIFFSILPSPRAQLGKRAMEELSSGQSLSDAVVVDLLEESLRKISNNLIYINYQILSSVVNTVLSTPSLRKVIILIFFIVELIGSSVGSSMDSR